MGQLGISRGAALYVGALIGPGLLLVPALAVQAAGAASIIAWGALLVLSAPLAITFAALGVRHPVAGGVAAYVREGLGEDAAAVTGGWFLAAVADRLARGIGDRRLLRRRLDRLGDRRRGGRRPRDVRCRARREPARAACLLRLPARAVLGADRRDGGRHLGRAADARRRTTGRRSRPHGWWAVGTAANILVWLFVGWEAVAQLAGDFRRPALDLPRAMAVAFAVVTVLYVGARRRDDRRDRGHDVAGPARRLDRRRLRPRGRDATAVLAVALTMGTMNVYIGGCAKLAASLAGTGALPAWFAGDAHRSVPRRPLCMTAPVVGS